MIGSVIDKYEVLDKVGEGGMATVYLGKHTTLGRVVAIKVLHPHLSASTRNRTRFAREARAIEHLHHENILEIYDYSGVDVDDCYIVTEFVPGRTLQGLLAERGLVPSEVATIVGLRLASALEYAHQSGIIHRDLKPENVMLRIDGTVKLMDFGIARFLDESTVTMTGSLVGSPAYMSPEQALEKTVDSRSDLFSLGSLLYHLVTGRMPFSGSNPSIVLRNIIESRRTEVLEAQPSVSPLLADTIERLLQTDPEARFESATQVCEALADVLAEAEIDPKMKVWSLRSYLEDSDHYEEGLKAHLGVVLLARGKRAFREGDHLGAQRLFNRLLAQDPENPEVLELLSSQALFEPVGRSAVPERRGVWLVAVGALVLTVSLVAFAILRPNSPGIKDPDPTLGTSDGTVVEEPLTKSVPLPPVEPEVVLEDAPDPEPPPILSRPPADLTVLPTPPAVVPSMADATGTFRFKVSVGDGTFQKWGEVYIDGQHVGQLGAKGLETEVAPGEHEVEVTGTEAVPFRKTLFVGADELVDVSVLLPYDGIVVRFHASFDTLCDVSADGQSFGELRDLRGRELRLRGPSAQHMVELNCPNQELRSFTAGGKAGQAIDFPL